MKEEKTCYDCKYSQPILYSKKLYCFERDKLVKENSKLCKKFKEVERRI